MAMCAIGQTFASAGFSAALRFSMARFKNIDAGTFRHRLKEVNTPKVSEMGKSEGGGSEFLSSDEVFSARYT
jgi:hypothetical protein